LNIGKGLGFDGEVVGDLLSFVSGDYGIIEKYMKKK